MTQRMKSILAVLLLCTLMLVSAGCGAEQEASPDETTRLPDVVFETTYCTISIPGEYGKYINHREVVDGQNTLEVFSMPMGSGERELFRLYFGDENTGDLLGTFHVDGQELPVTLAVTHYGADAFAEEITAQKYYQAMDALDYVLSSVRSDQRFVGKDELTIEKNDQQIENWTFSLPQNMQWEKTDTKDGYRLDFFGNVNGEKYPLYSVAFGSERLETLLGVFNADASSQLVSIEGAELPDTKEWSDSDEMELYSMMDSINDVISVIMSDQNFSTEILDKDQL